MIHHRRVKIVATLGPASGSPEVIADLLDAGADVFRLNFSHGNPDTHRTTHGILRDLEAKTGRPIGILVDLQGPKLRLGTFAGGAARLEENARFRLDLSDEPGDDKRAPLPHPEVFAAIERGTDLLIDDGRIRLRVEESGDSYAETTVVTGGELSDRKGINLPHALLPLSALTEKDRTDLAFALELGVDWIGLSFVQRPDDIREARELIGARAAVLSKIEKPAAIIELDEIIALSDAIMVARGDLGVELPVEEGPGLQKRIIRAAREAGKPVVVATQMLESMVQSPAPTRAEVSDVATAVYDGADAVMLSAESATGDYPVASVAMMDRIARQVEQDPLYESLIDAVPVAPEATTADAISAAARQVAETLDAAAIVTFTTSGSTALRAGRNRPRVPILALTPNFATARRLMLAWGLRCVHTEDATDFAHMLRLACRHAVSEGLASKGDQLVVTAGSPFGTPGTTNVLRIAVIEHD